MLDIVRPDVRASWMMTASKAWGGALQAMAAAEDVDQIDMNLLLALKDIIPGIECRYTRLNLFKALGTVFRLALDHADWAQRYRQELYELSRWDTVTAVPESGCEEQYQSWQLALRVRSLADTGMAAGWAPAPDGRQACWPEAAGDGPSAGGQQPDPALEAVESMGFLSAEPRRQAGSFLWRHCRPRGGDVGLACGWPVVFRRSGSTGSWGSFPGDGPGYPGGAHAGADRWSCAGGCRLHPVCQTDRGVAGQGGFSRAPALSATAYDACVPGWRWTGWPWR